MTGGFDDVPLNEVPTYTPSGWTMYCAISPNFSQGGIENTGVATNAAIQGNGFFVVGDANAHRPGA